MRDFVGAVCNRMLLDDPGLARLQTVRQRSCRSRTYEAFSDRLLEKAILSEQNNNF